MCDAKGFYTRIRVVWPRNYGLGRGGSDAFPNLHPIPMADSIPPTSDNRDASSGKPDKGRRADYDQALANDITDAGALIENALDNPDVLEALSYSEDELREGLALQEEAQDKFAKRQKAQGVASAKKAARDELLDPVREDFTAFRTTVRNSFPVTALAALGASGLMPADLQKLITVMRSAYATAQTADYEPTLAKRKLGLTVLKARAKAAENLEKLDRAYKAADKAATAATTARNAAGEAMRKWTATFRKQAKSDLRRHPELKAKLGL